MTVQELSKLYYLNKLIKRNSLKLFELESQLLPSAANITGMPRSRSANNMTEATMAIIIDLKDRITRQQEEYMRARLEIEEYINSVEDYQIRLILAHRFIDLMSWQEISHEIGGGNTEDSVKKTCYRYLKKH